MSDNLKSELMKSVADKNGKSNSTTNTTSLPKLGLTVFTTRSAKDTIPVYSCNCFSGKYVHGEMYYCPECNIFQCGGYIGATGNAIKAAGNNEHIKWACLSCNTHVFLLDPILSTALALGLPIPITTEEEWEDDED